MLSPDLEVRAQTPATDAYLRELLPTEADRRPVPAGAYNVGAQLLANDDTRTVAETMFLSEHTVQDHLKSIFDKTGARNRRTLLARITGRVGG